MNLYELEKLAKASEGEKVLISKIDLTRLTDVARAAEKWAKGTVGVRLNSPAGIVLWCLKELEK